MTIINYSSAISMRSKLLAGDTSLWWCWFDYCNVAATTSQLMSGVTVPGLNWNVPAKHNNNASNCDWCALTTTKLNPEILCVTKLFCHL